MPDTRHPSLSLVMYASSTPRPHALSLACPGSLHRHKHTSPRPPSLKVHALREQHTAQWRARVKLFGGEPAVVLYDLVRQHEGLFARPPVGPLGAHMELEDAG